MILDNNENKITKKEFFLFKEYIYKYCGISIPDEKLYLIESRLTKLVVESGCEDFTEFYFKVESNKLTNYKEKIIDAITTNETLWFRDKKYWDLLKYMIENYCSENRFSKIRIWSCACSTGQEPYSLAMLIDDICSKNKISSSKFEIVATDISPTVLFMAEKGIYNQVSIRRGLEEYYKEKYFTKAGNLWILNNKIKSMVKFKKFNLQNSFISFGKFDIILCRNVLIYFSKELKKEIIDKITKILNENGKLILGSSEMLFNISDEYEKKVYLNAIYYELKKGTIKIGKEKNTLNR